MLGSRVARIAHRSVDHSTRRLRNSVPVAAQHFVDSHPLPLTFDKKEAILLSNVEGKMPPSTDLLQGTLDMLILKTLAPGQEHGWAIAQRIQEMSNNVLQIGQGSLYPALHRLEYRGWIKATWGASENNRRARFYALTAAGRRQLDAEMENWDRLTGAINLVLQGI